MSDVILARTPDGIEILIKEFLASQQPKLRKAAPEW
jgi:hypothetical protein